MIVYVATHWYSMVHEHIWVHDGDQLVEQVWLRLKELRGQVLHHILQLLGGIARSAIPRLWLSPANQNNKSEWKTSFSDQRLFLS